MKAVQAFATLGLGILHLIGAVMFQAEGNHAGAMAQAIGGVFWLLLSIYRVCKA